MKLFSILMLFTSLGMSAGIPPSLAYYIDLSSTNMLATYPAGPQLQATAFGGKFAKVDFINTSSSDIEVNCYSTTKPSAAATGSFVVVAGTGYTTYAQDNIQVPLLGSCWARSFSGTISSGKFEMVGWQY